LGACEHSPDPDPDPVPAPEAAAEEVLAAPPADALAPPVALLALLPHPTIVIAASAAADTSAARPLHRIRCSLSAVVD